jgi:cytochrome P450
MAAERSATVTRERVVFDPRAPGFTADPYPLWHRLRVEDPVHRSPMGFWVLTRYDDIAVVLRTPRLFGAGHTPELMRSRYGDGAAFAYVSRRMSSYDPPDHTRLRSLVTRAFTVRRVESMRPHIQALTDALLDTTGTAQQMDVIATLAHPLPSLVICEMICVPAVDRPRFSAWTSAIAFLLPRCSPTSQTQAVALAEGSSAAVTWTS